MGNKTFNQRLGANLKNLFFAKFCSKLLTFLTFFQLFSTKYAVNENFNKHFGCAASKHWSKYTTADRLKEKLCLLSLTPCCHCIWLGTLCLHTREWTRERERERERISLIALQYIFIFSRGQPNVSERRWNFLIKFKSLRMDEKAGPFE